MNSHIRARTPRRVRAISAGSVGGPLTLDGMSTAQAMATFARLGREVAGVRADGSVTARRALAPPAKLPTSCNGDRAPHPSHGPADQLPRRDDGTLDHFYGMDKTDFEGTTLADYVPERRVRADGWTPQVQAQFVRALADGGSVTRACQAVQRSRVSAYRLRRDPSARTFARAWDEALASTTALLAETALDRAVNGVEEAVYHKGERVGTRVRHDNRLLFAMLRARDPLNYAPLDELERWEARRAPSADPHALADELEREEEAWQHAPKDELEAAGRLPLDTATLALEREEEAARREHVKRTNASGTRARKARRVVATEAGKNSAQP